MLLKEQHIANLITEELKKSDVINLIKKDKDFEKVVRGIVKDVVKDMYRVLWMHNNIFNSLGK